jgi:hypothetical protein
VAVGDAALLPRHPVVGEDTPEAPVAEVYCSPRVPKQPPVPKDKQPPVSKEHKGDSLMTPPRPSGKVPAGSKIRPVSQMLSDVVYIQVRVAVAP